MYEHRREKLLSPRAFLRRLLAHLGAAALVVFVSLLVGVLGYHFLDTQDWIDSLVNSAMLLGGMGPVGNLHTVAGKVFAAAFALYAGLVFLVLAGILFAPVMHRMLHKFHIEGRKD